MEVFKSLLSIIFISILFSNCGEKAERIYDSGHLKNPSRQFIPEPDIRLRLLSQYDSILQQKLKGEIKYENYTAHRRDGNEVFEIQIQLGRNDKGQVLFLEEFLSEKYVNTDSETIQTYFFDKYGRVFGIEQQTNSTCNGLDAHQIIVKYFDSSFDLLNVTYVIRDTEGEYLDKEICASEFDTSIGSFASYAELLESFENGVEKR